jgi:tetratricopeptide (TPR) repeat protein/predicted Ser/Thr protein kinase
MIGTTVSHYKILEKLGEGGMGVVYRAEDTKLERIVALKFLPSNLIGKDEDKKRFIREARSTSSLNHPNIMTIYEIDEVEDQTFIAMEFLEGKTLKNVITRTPPDNSKALDIAIAVAEGLLAAHSQDIIHRDIKSENVMLSDKGHIKIMDFGLAKRKGVKGMTRAGTTLGTLAYMSPEQIEGLDADFRSDIFSLGVVMYEMATGKLPFHGDHDAAILYSIVNELPAPVSTINPKIDLEFVRIIHKCIEKDPNKRYQNSKELLDDLKDLRSALDSGLTTGKIVGIPPADISSKKLTWINPVIIIAAIAIVMYLIFGIRSRQNSQVLTDLEAVENSLAVLYFENLRDPEDTERLGQILQELIIADLSEISQLKVFSSQRLFDIQKQLGTADRSKINPALATEIAQMAGASTILNGTVIQTGDSIILTSQLIDPSDGTIIESQRVQGSDIYTLVDELADLIHQDLDLPSDESDRIDVAVVDKTSASVNAYQFYLEGVDFYNDANFIDAIVAFQQAIGIDSTFSQAYYKMALAQWWAQSESDIATLDQAKSSLAAILSGRWYTSTKEKLMAQGAMALTDQDFDRAQDIYLQLLSFIPDEKEAWYGLGEAYFHGPMDYDKSFEAFERVLELDPDLILAYRHLFDIYSVREQYDQGIIRASQFVSNYPDKPWGYIYLGMMFHGKREYSKAIDVFKEAITINPDMSSAQQGLIDLYFHSELYNQGIAYADSMASIFPEHSWIYTLRGICYTGLGQFDQAIEAYQDGLIIDPEDYGIVIYLTYTYQLMGDYGRANDQLINLLDDDIAEVWKKTGKHLQNMLLCETGQLNRVLEIKLEEFRDLETNDSKAGNLINQSYFRFLLQDTVTARANLAQASALNPNIKNQLLILWITGFFHAVAGEKEALEQAQYQAEELIEANYVTSELRYISIALQLNMYLLENDYQGALQEFEKIKKFENIGLRYLSELASAFLTAGDYEKVHEFVAMMRKPNISSDIRSHMYPRSYYFEGLAFERAGNLTSALQSYEQLMIIWRDGDESIPERQTAINRIEELRRIIG